VLTIGEIRTAFPFAIESAYLNTAAVGLSPARQGHPAADWATSRGIAGREIWVGAASRARARLAALLGVRSEQLCFTGSTTEGLNLVALGLPLNAGDRVAVLADEFPSVLQPWIGLQTRRIQIERLEVFDESARSETLASAVKNGARAVAVSHVHWRTGARVDLEQLSAVCRQHHAWLVVDGVQAVGPIAVDATLADAYCASSFKWLLSGFGLGFLSLSDRLRDKWTPPFRGYGNEWPSKDAQYGHLNYPGIHALNASLDSLESVGWNAIHRRVAGLTSQLMETLRARQFHVVTPDAARAGIVSIRHKAATAIVCSLAQDLIYVEDRGELVRASPYFYNTEDDVDRFVTALARYSHTID
jgi:selenocysteine lyase/cysteine desulfurase